MGVRLTQDSVFELGRILHQGSGSASLMRSYSEETISEGQFKDIQRKHPFIRSKEEYYYFRIFTEHFGDGHAVHTVGQWMVN